MEANDSPTNSGFVYTIHQLLINWSLLKGYFLQLGWA